MIKKKFFQSVSLLSFGAYLPYYRLKAEEICQKWGQKEEKEKQNLPVMQKAVADIDEDSVTMAVEASLMALRESGLKPAQLGSVFMGSESHPYAVKPSGTIIADILGMDNSYFCADLQFACKAGTTGLQITAGLIEAGIIDYGLVIASDKAQSQPGDILEYTAAAAAGAFILGKKKSSALADIIATYSFNSDTPDFWRRQTCLYPQHSGRFTGEPGYFFHLESCLKAFLKIYKKKIKDFDFLVFHMPNCKFPFQLGKKLGAKPVQFESSLIVNEIGNPYTASSFLGLISVLMQAKKGAQILMASYGSGAGSDVFWLKVKNEVNKKERENWKKMLKNYSFIDYSTYLQNYKVIL